MSGADDPIRAKVRDSYAAAARQILAGPDSGCGCGPECGEAIIGDNDPEVFGAALYGDPERGSVPDAAQLASLGCGNPTAVADLNEGETVLDLGCGGGIDVLLSARRVGPTGKAYGLDMTDEMLELALQNQREAEVNNAEFLKGRIEKVPLPDDSVDVVISNCVINLSTDKPQVFREAARVLRPGGRLAFTDVVADEDMDDETKSDIAQWASCIAGALTDDEYRRELRASGFEDIEVRETHRVHERAGSAIIRASLAASPE